MQTIRFTHNTFLKEFPVQASELPASSKEAMPLGEELELHSYGPKERGHYKISLAKARFQGRNTWFVYADHIEIYDGTQRIVPPVAPTSVKLKVPYKSQRDNVNNPDGSCNVTSVAMCLEFLGFKSPHQGQLEDYLYTKMLSLGLSRHDPHDLATIIEQVGINQGIRDRFVTNATIDQVKAHLAEGFPCITHGYFTSFGHIICLVGFDATGFLAHDPYGEWFNWGYQRNAHSQYDEQGKYVHYSYDLIKRLCIPDGSFWVHFISR